MMKDENKIAALTARVDELEKWQRVIMQRVVDLTDILAKVTGVNTDDEEVKDE